VEFKNLLFDVEEGVATITFNRPKAMNAMNTETMNELMDAILICKKDDSIKSLLLTGAGGKSFIAGGDIAEMLNKTAPEALEFFELGQETYRALEVLPKPSIAAIDGFALGGGVECAMACDVRFCSAKTVFGQPEITIGLIPGWGGSQRLARLVGFGIAKEIIMGGGQTKAQRAYELGLVNRVYETSEELMAESKKFAKKLASLPGFALKMAKHCINYGYDISLDHAQRIEAECCAQCFSTHDRKEGMTAFMEKRKPVYIGK